MEDHELRAILQRLPDARPGAVFTAEVLARVERFERQRLAGGAGGAGGRTDRAHAGGARWRPTLLAAGLAAALMAAVGLWQPLGGGRWFEGGGGEAAVSAETRAERPAEGDGGGRAGGGEHAAAAGAVAERSATRRPPLADRGSAATATGAAPAEERLATAAGPAGGSASPSPLLDGHRDAAPPAPALPADEVAAPPGADFFAAPPAGEAPPAAADPAVLPAADRLARLRAEREALERRLVAFRRELPPAEPPVVLLGGDEGLELVFDLGRWAAAPPAGEAAGAARPAVHSTQGPPRRF